MASHLGMLTLLWYHASSLCSRAKLTKQPPDRAVLMVNPELSWYFLAWVQCFSPNSGLLSSWSMVKSVFIESCCLLWLCAYSPQLQNSQWRQIISFIVFTSTQCLICTSLMSCRFAWAHAHAFFVVLFSFIGPFFFFFFWSEKQKVFFTPGMVLLLSSNSETYYLKEPFFKGEEVISWPTYSASAWWSPCTSFSFTVFIVWYCRVSMSWEPVRGMYERPIWMDSACF